MEGLGFWGILKLTIKITLRNLKHFLCIAFLLALPSALIFVLFGPSSQWIQTLVTSASLLHKITASHNLTPDDEILITSQQQALPDLPLLIVVSIVRFPISLLCVLLVTFSVCRAYLNKSLDLKGSLEGARRSAMNLLVTVLAVAAVMVGVAVMGVVGMMIVVAVVMAVNENLVVIPIAIMAVGVIGGEVYMAVMLGLANTVAIAEEKKGWEAMRRSMYLIRGSKWVVIGLYCLYGILSMASLFVWVPKDAFTVSRWVVGGIGVGLQTLITLCRMVSVVVLYMSCKSKHAEPLDTLLPASAKFGPQNQKLASKYLDLETAAFTISTP